MTEIIDAMPNLNGMDQQQFAQALVAQARSEGVELIGPAGLLTGLTKSVLETALEAELTQEERSRIRKEPTDDVEAYQLYLQGRHCMHRWTGEGMEQGIRHLEQATAQDDPWTLTAATIRDIPRFEWRGAMLD